MSTWDKIVGNPDRQFSEEKRRSRMMGGYDDLTARSGTMGSRASSEYMARAMAFDPSQAVTQFGQGFMDEASEALGQQMEDFTGSSLGAGRLKSGFFQRDSGRMFQDFNRRVSNAIAAQSMNAARMQMQNTQNLGAFGSEMMGMQSDLIAGGLDRATAEENARTSPWDVAMDLGGTAMAMWNPFGGGGGGMTKPAPK